ncbi:MAG TPA: hypothetical protein VLJ86_10640 [Ramlibacter sp.]|nr:hypothetical protein [Ramlibacter sp.]
MSASFAAKAIAAAFPSPAPFLTLTRLPQCLLLATLATAGVGAHASCGSAFCSVNTDWTSDSLGTAEGRSFDVRYERIHQNQPRTGSTRIAVGQIPHHHDEVSTVNQNLLLQYSQTYASGWGYAVVAPVVNRDHLHVHNHRGTPIPEAWKFTELGDVRVTARRQLAVGDQESGSRSAGFVFGMKLPTGRTGVANDSGDVAERSLQPGSGTTDAIVGAFYHQQMAARGASWFGQVQYQRPLKSHDDFAPGGQFTADLGYAQRLGAALSGLVQLNAVIKQRDRGAQAEPADSGSRSLYLSPGLGWDMTDTMRVYAFYQVPLRQSVNGVQLTANKAVTVGLSTRF